MTSKPCYLFDLSTQPPTEVEGSIIHDFPITELVTIEQIWSPYRKALDDRMVQKGFTIEHDHWDWTQKMRSIARGRHRLVAISARGMVQGLMAFLGYSRTARLDPIGELLYVDYIENAPWNLVPFDNTTPFAPIGKRLMAEAIRISLDCGYGGRIGLHSLSTAEPFYRDKLGMSDFGPDGNYGQLCYFEFEAIAAQNWLERVS